MPDRESMIRSSLECNESPCDDPVSSFLALHKQTSEPVSILEARANVIRVLSIFVAMFAFGLFVADMAGQQAYDPQSFLGLVLSALAAVSWFLLKNGRLKAVSWLLVISLFSVGVASIYFYGSVRTVGNYLIVAGLVAGGVFLSRMLLLWTTLGAIVLVIGMSWAEYKGWLLGTPTFETGLRTWITQVACLVGVSVMVYSNRTQMQHARNLHLVECKRRLHARLKRDSTQERFIRVFRSSPTPIYVQSARSGVILSVNPAFERVMGYDLQRVVGKRDKGFWLQDRQYDEFMRRRASRLRTDWCPITGMCRDGRQVALFICSEMDENPEDSLVITALRLCNSPTAEPWAGRSTRQADSALEHGGVFAAGAHNNA